MALVCHDQYDHPLLWCDEKRRAEERKIANEGLATIEQQKKQAELQKHREANEVSAYLLPLKLVAVRCHKKTVSQRVIGKIKLSSFFTIKSRVVEPIPFSRVTNSDSNTYTYTHCTIPCISFNLI